MLLIHPVLSVKEHFHVAATDVRPKINTLACVECK